MKLVWRRHLMIMTHLKLVIYDLTLILNSGEKPQIHIPDTYVYEKKNPSIIIIFFQMKASHFNFFTFIQFNNENLH